MTSPANSGQAGSRLRLDSHRSGDFAFVRGPSKIVMASSLPRFVYWSVSRGLNASASSTLQGKRRTTGCPVRLDGCSASARQADARAHDDSRPVGLEQKFGDRLTPAVWVRSLEDYGIHRSCLREVLTEYAARVSRVPANSARTSKSGLDKYAESDIVIPAHRFAAPFDR